MVAVSGTWLLTAECLKQSLLCGLTVDRANKECGHLMNGPLALVLLNSVDGTELSASFLPATTYFPARATYARKLSIREGVPTCKAPFPEVAIFWKIALTRHELKAIHPATRRERSRSGSGIWLVVPKSHETPRNKRPDCSGKPIS